MLTYREVHCPICDKKYMWQVACEQDIYFADGEGRRVAVMSKCPQCYSELAVFTGALNAVRVEDLAGKLKRVKEYGI